MLEICCTFATANDDDGAIAQLVEQRTENPCVPGSIPGGTTPPFIRAVLLLGLPFFIILPHRYLPQISLDIKISRRLRRFRKSFIPQCLYDYQPVNFTERFIKRLQNKRFAKSA